MAERDVPRGTPDPLVLALADLVRAVHAKRTEDRTERRRTMTVVEGGKRRGGEAA